MTATAAALEIVRRTTTAHLDAVDALERAVGAEMAQLATDRRALEDDRAAFIKNTEEKLAREEDDKARMRAAAPPPDEVVALNVGGAPFKASRAVLARVEDSMLGRLFGSCDAMLQADPLDGSIFIDRDGERFGMVLDFLRGDPPDGPRMQRAIRALPEAAQEALVQELDFFGLVTAVFGVPPWTDGAPFRQGPIKSSGRYLDMAQLAADRRALQDDRATMMQHVGEKLARGRAEVDEQRAAVERDSAEFNDEVARMRAAAPPPDEMVKLNVGGSCFKTSRAVLTKVEDSMLGRMFSRCDAMLQPDPSDGAIFIDRDGARFGMVLDFLRDLDGPRTRRTIRALAEAAQESMTKELEFFGLDTAVFGARPWTHGATFRPGPAMCSPGRSLGAAVFAGRRVVVFGGLLDGTHLNHLNTTELIDTQTMAVTAGPNMLTGRSRCAAVQIGADCVLLVGGYNGTMLNTTEIFHLSTLTFTPGPNMQSSRFDCAALALDARRILVIGGHDGVSFLSTTEIFSLDTMAFAPGPAMATPREGCAAVALDEHRILVAGGHSGSESVLTTTEVLYVRTMAFTPGPSMSSARTFCAAVPVDAQHVLIIGGQDSETTQLATTELLDVAMLEFSPGPTMLSARSGFTAACLDAAGDGRRILMLGGRGSTTEMLAVDAQTGARHRR